MTGTTPRDAAARSELDPSPWPGGDERYAGYGVMGLPFASGHYLAFRRFPSTPFGRPYTSVWHRPPDGGWTFFVDAPSTESCPRYFDAAIRASVRTDIQIAWSAPDEVTLDIPGVLHWRVRLRRTAATTLMSAMASRLPDRAWERRSVLAAMGPMAGAMLRVGRVRLAGTAPNGQWFAAGPRLVWGVERSAALLHGEDLGLIGPQAEQHRLGDFLLPRAGLFMAGRTIFETFDPARHLVARPALTTADR